MQYNDLFISYSRKDSGLVKMLFAALSGQYQNIWVDWEDIPPSAAWWQEISDAIAGAASFVVILSPDYISSEVCLNEIREAETAGKKIIPVVARTIVPEPHLPQSMRRLNWIRFDQGNDFNVSVTLLDQAIKTDLAWLKFHTRLLVRAKEWQQFRSDAAYHLYGSDLKEAIHEVEKHKAADPPLTSLQHNFIEASKLGEKLLIKKQLQGFYIAALVYTIIQVFVLYFVIFDELSETALVNLSWVWLPGLSFALAGFTVGKYSIKKSFVAVGVVCVLFFLFYAVLWQSL